MAKTRWLNEDEQKVWLDFLATNALLQEALDHQLQRDAGLPHAYYMILAILSQEPDRAMRMSELAVATQSSQSRLTHAVNRLEAIGYVRRERLQSDRRGFNAVLTDEGFAVLEAAAPGHVEAVRSNLFDSLNETQVKQLGRICQSILKTLDPTGDSPVRARA